MHGGLGDLFNPDGQCAFFGSGYYENALEFSAAQNPSQWKPLQFTIDPSNGQLSGGGFTAEVPFNPGCVEFDADIECNAAAEGLSGSSSAYTPITCTYDGVDGGAVSCTATIQYQIFEPRSAGELTVLTLNLHNVIIQGSSYGKQDIMLSTPNLVVPITLVGVWNIAECAGWAS